jgi:uncharacterized membrane protein
MKSNSLKTVCAELTINASKDVVWNVWAQFNNVADYAASIPKSYSLAGKSSGLGASRRCDISKTVQVDEMITEWLPGERYTMEVIASKGVPIKTMEVSYMVARNDTETTLVTIEMRYRMKGLFHYLPVKRAMQQQARDHLMGLKHHVETGELVSAEMLKAIRKRYAYECHTLI